MTDAGAYEHNLERFAECTRHIVPDLTGFRVNTVK
jgi:hypothetical protein